MPVVTDTLQPIWIDRAERIGEVITACSRAARIGLDTEADSLHSYFHKVCLIQVTADEETFLLDPLRLTPEDLTPLWQITGDPATPVLMHGADYDVRVLDRDFGARIRGLEDTQIMAQLLGEPRTGLSAMLSKELGVTLEKKHQRADWGRRPLDSELLVYAAADTAWLADLADRLHARLEALGRWSWAEEEFRALEEVRHTPTTPDPYGFERIKGARGLRGAARDRLFTLHRWREQQAQKADVPPFRVLGNKPMLDLAQNPPSEPGGVADVDGLGHRFAARRGTTIVRLLARPEAAPPFRRGRPERQPPEVRARYTKLAAARDTVATELGLQPGLVGPRALLEQIASCRPTPRGFDDLRACGLDGWRLEVLGRALLEAPGDEGRG